MSIEVKLSAHLTSMLFHFVICAIYLCHTESGAAAHVTELCCVLSANGFIVLALTRRPFLCFVLDSVYGFG